MFDRYAWRDDERLKAFLAGCLRRGQLALCLGSGVSLPFKIPTWKSLIDDIAASHGAPSIDVTDLPAAASHIEEDCFGGQRGAFLQALRETLYKQVDRESLAESLASNKTLQSLGALATPSIAGSIRTIISFNYDDLMESFLERHGVRVRSITACNFVHEPTDVSVIHPHGFIPLNAGRPAGETVVLTGKDFLAAQNNWVGQLWDEAILEVLRRHVVIFLGVSGTDERLMSLIGRAWEHHSYNVANCPFFGVRLDAGNETQFLKWNERGVFVREIKDFDNEIADFLYDIKTKDYERERIERSLA